MKKSRPINGTELIIDVRNSLNDLELTDVSQMTGKKFIATKDLLIKKFNTMFKDFDGSENSVSVKSKHFFNIQRRFNNFVILCNILLGIDFQKIVHTNKRLKWEQEQAELPADSMCYNEKKFTNMIIDMTRGKYFQTNI